MPTQLQIRRGSTSDHTSFTGAAGELTVNTTKDTVLVHDGSTAGGFELARADGSNLNAITNDITVTGTVNAQTADISTKVIVNGTTPRLELFESDVTDLNTRIRVTSGNLQIQSTDDAGTTTQTRVAIDNSDGEFALYNAAGAAKKLVWDATNLRLGINNATPTQTLDVTGDIQTSGGIYVGGSAEANKLDDYEEGTFDPEIADASSGGNTGTATSLEGYYTKVGQQVVVTLKIENIDTTGMTAANNLFIRDLPFTAASGAKGQSQGSLRLDRVNLDANCCGIVCATAGNGSYLTLRQTINNASDAQIKVQDFTSGSADIFATITYFVS